MSKKKLAILIGGLITAGTAGYAVVNKNKEQIKVKLAELKVKSKEARKENLEVFKEALDEMSEEIEEELAEIRKEEEAELDRVLFGENDDDIEVDDEYIQVNLFGDDDIDEDDITNEEDVLPEPEEMSVELVKQLEFLNTASHEELKSIPRVGDTVAQYIIENRPYHSAEDVKLVKRIPYTVLGFDILDELTEE